MKNIWFGTTQTVEFENHDKTRNVRVKELPWIIKEINPDFVFKAVLKKGSLSMSFGENS